MKSVNIEWNVNLRQAFFCIARALDSVGVDDINHGHRVGYMAYSCAQAMEWSEEECQLVFALGLIHDCGVAQKRDFYRLLENMQPDNTSSIACEAMSCCRIVHRLRRLQMRFCTTIRLGMS